MTHTYMHVQSLQRPCSLLLLAVLNFFSRMIDLIPNSLMIFTTVLYYYYYYNKTIALRGHWDICPNIRTYVPKYKEVSPG